MPLPQASNLAKAALAGALGALLSGCGVAESCKDRPEGCETLSLQGTLPIYWGEAAGMQDLLDGTTETGWVRRRLERDYDLSTLSWLADGALDGEERLLLAQPRAPSPQENVALDEWVRGGGKLLLFADPMLTGHSRFGIGDPRRPQDVIVLSPILRRWGLEMAFDPEGDPTPRGESGFGVTVPVALAGELSFFGGEAAGKCKFSPGRVIAHCAIGRGKVTILADAHVIEHAAEAEPEEGDADALDALLRLAFDR